MVTTDGTGVVSHAGTALLRELAERVGLRAGFAEATGGLRQRRSGHDPGQVLTDLAVMLADGGEAISDISALIDQPRLHGPVASGTTAWRVLAGLDTRKLVEIRATRAQANPRRASSSEITSGSAVRTERLSRIAQSALTPVPYSTGAPIGQATPVPWSRQYPLGVCWVRGTHSVHD